MTRIAVAGAGLTGCLLAARLADRGHRVDVFERRPDPRRVDVGGGRSINLALSTRGLDALDRIGLAEELRAVGVAVRGRMMHDRDGHLTFQPYSGDPANVLWSVNRDRLNQVVLEAADARHDVHLHFDRRLVDVEVPAADEPIELVLAATDGHEHRQRVEALLGADGASSAVRGRLQRLRQFDYEQDYLEHGYKELTIPAGPGGDHQLDPHALHIWPRGEHMMIALANPDGSFTCTLFWPFAGDIGFESVDTATDVIDVFERVFPDAVPLMPDLAEQYLANPTSSLVTVSCHPWNHGSILLVGDAAHAVVPFYGQGANAALEDVTVLLDELDREPGDWAAAFARFAAIRKPDTDALAELALDNFVEMRARVRSRRFLARRALERRLHRRFPDRIVTLYELVTFTRTPYAEALARARRQDRLVGRLAVAAIAVALVVALVVVVAIVTVVSWWHGTP